MPYIYKRGQTQENMVMPRIDYKASTSRVYFRVNIKLAFQHLSQEIHMSMIPVPRTAVTLSQYGFIKCRGFIQHSMYNLNKMHITDCS